MKVLEHAYPLKTIKYQDILNLGFEVIVENDDVFFEEHGYPYKIITKELTSTVSLDWDQTTGKCRLIRASKKGKTIRSTIIVPNLEVLLLIMDFFVEDYMDLP